MAKLEQVVRISEKNPNTLLKGFVCIERRVLGIHGTEYSHVIRYLMPRRRYRRMLVAMHENPQSLNESVEKSVEGLSKVENVADFVPEEQPLLYHLEVLADDEEETVKSDTNKLTSTDIEEAIAAQDLDELMANLEGIVKSYAEISVNIKLLAEGEIIYFRTTIAALLRLLIRDLKHTRDDFKDGHGSLVKNIMSNRSFAAAIPDEKFAKLMSDLPKEDRPDLTFSRINERLPEHEILNNLEWYIVKLQLALSNAKSYGEAEKRPVEKEPEQAGATTNQKDTVELLKAIIERMKNIRMAIVAQKENYIKNPETFYTAMAIIVRVTQAVPEHITAGLWERLPEVPKNATKIPLGRTFAILLAKEIGIKPPVEWEA